MAVRVTAVGESRCTGAPEEPGEVARWKAMVAGVAVVVYERIAGNWLVTEVNGAAEELLGHPAARWRAEPDLGRRVFDPADRELLAAAMADAIAGGGQFAVDHRVRTADGRLRWVRQSGYVDRGDGDRGDGHPVRVNAVLIDVTEHHRQARASALLADAGSVLAGPDPVEQRLRAIAELVAGERCDWSAVWVHADEGRFRPVAGGPAELADRVLALAPLRVPGQFADAVRAGAPFVVPDVPEQVLAAATDDREHQAELTGLGGSTWLVAPLLVAGEVVGLLTLTSDSASAFDDADLALAADLGHRLATMVAADRRDAQRQELYQLQVALAAAGTVAEAAAAVSSGLRTILGASVVWVCTAGEGLLHTVDVAGYPTERLPPYLTIPLSARLPVTDAARDGEPVWLTDRTAIVEAYPSTASILLPGTEGMAALPLLVADRLVGALSVSFLAPRPFSADEQLFLLTVAGHVATAFERAGLADARREMAETLQRSLLPGPLPALDGVAVTARYLPAVAGTSAGGDWYDVLETDGGTVAVAVGDVVGHGAPAAAAMGQLRSALATLLLAGFGPARALELLDRFAEHVPGARVATVACVLLDRRTGRLRWSSAGHPPPLLLGAGAEYLAGGTGPALGVEVSRPRTEAVSDLAPGGTVLLYTDGLVERRGVDLDDGLGRLAELGSARRAVPLPGLVDDLITGLVDPTGAADDVAVVGVRLLPAPLRLEVIGDPTVLSGVRRSVGSWASGAGLDPATLEDLQLALGEAAGNAAEHAYRDAPAPGPMHVELVVATDGSVAAEVSDTGAWRPVPADPGHRGRGLQMITALARDVDLRPGPAGTTIRFRIGPPTGAVLPGPSSTPDPSPDQRVAAVTVTRGDTGTRVELVGDLDHGGVAAVRGELVAAATGPGPLVVDLRRVGWLTSVGVSLLVELAAHPGHGVTFVPPSTGPARRVLDLAGVTSVLLGGPP